MKFQLTNRGFGLIEFTDRYGSECSIQDSSLATEPAIWIGVTNPEVKVLEKGKGWEGYPIPEDALINGRMHLTQEMVKKILPYLQHFAETGEYIKDYSPFEINKLIGPKDG